MIRSMTGFGRAERTADNLHLTAELKSVNNRYLDLNVRMPRRLSQFDGKVRAYLKDRLTRGKVEIFISCERFGEADAALRFRPELAASYFRYMEEMRETFSLDAKVRPVDLARMPEVFTLEEETPEETLWEDLKAVLSEATDQFIRSREEEGSRLRSDLSEKLSHLAELASLVEEREPEILKKYRARLTEKVAELLGSTQIDESRIASEIVIYADKICTDEETTRLKSHVEAMRKELERGDGVGKKLDFLAQELNREANTILSKANDLPTSDLGIELKTEIEKIREQIQNIE